MMHRAGYWEGIASGAAVLTTTYGSPDRESVLPQLSSWARKVHGSNSVVFSAMVARISLFAEATFQFQAKDDKHLFGNTNLAILEEPFGPGTTSGDLLARMQLDRSLAGNAFIWEPPGEDFLVRLRPDWTTIISELVQFPGGGQYRRRLGYWVEPPAAMVGEGHGQFYPVDEVSHWAPQPDPDADFRGMSWLTPAYRDITGDDGLTTYKIKYLENSASPNMLIRYVQKLAPGTIDSIRERVTSRYGGASNAFKTLVLDQGADATIIGNSLQQMNFDATTASGEERILAAANVPGVVVGLEPLRGAGRGYQESMQKFANIFARPEWRSVCGALSKIANTPGGNRLWFDTSDIAALQDGEMEKGQTTLVKSQSVLALSQAGKYTADSIVTAVDAGDISLLKEAPAPPPLAGGAAVQHLLPQTPPGAVAAPLPAANPRLAVGPASVGDGGDNTRPTPRPSAARRALNGSNGKASDG
jgi:phage portal protein BeeE